MPTFMDATNTIRRSDDAPPPQGLDYGNLRKQVILALIEKMATQDPEERAAKLNLMGAQAEHERGLAHAATNNPKYRSPYDQGGDAVDEAQGKLDRILQTPEMATKAVLDKDKPVDAEYIERIVAPLGQNFDASKVEPQIQRALTEMSDKYKAADQTVLKPVLDALRDKTWQEIERRGLKQRTSDKRLYAKDSVGTYFGGDSKMPTHGYPATFDHYEQSAEWLSPAEANRRNQQRSGFKGLFQPK